MRFQGPDFRVFDDNRGDNRPAESSLYRLDLGSRAMASRGLCAN